MALTETERGCLTAWTKEEGVRGYFHNDGPETEEDVTQETVVRILGREDLRVRTSIGALAWRTASNIRKDLQKRSKARHVPDMNSIPGREIHPADTMAAAEFVANLREIMKQLPEADRRVLELRYVENLRPERIGPIIGIKPSAVTMRVGRARERLLKLAARWKVDLAEGMHLLETAL